jgi:hypothetical protein
MTTCGPKSVSEREAIEVIVTRLLTGFWVFATIQVSSRKSTKDKLLTTKEKKKQKQKKKKQKKCVPFVKRCSSSLESGMSSERVGGEGLPVEPLESGEPNVIIVTAVLSSSGDEHAVAERAGRDE